MSPTCHYEHGFNSDVLYDETSGDNRLRATIAVDFLHLKDGHLPFDNSGILLEKCQLSGLPSP